MKRNFFWMLAWVLLISCATSPTGRQQMILMPESAMESLGTEAFADMKNKIPIERDRSTNAYVHCVAESITEATKSSMGARNWEIVVFRSNEINAFALPGAKIGVYTGLLKVAKTPDQLAAVLGHEVGHVVAQHGNERMSAALGADAAMIGAGELMRNNKNRNLILGVMGVGAQVGLLLPHSRTQESEADTIGLDLMARAGWDPRESVELWKNMSAAAEGAPPEFLSTHPSHSSRIRDLTNQMNRAVGIANAANSQGLKPHCER